ANSWLMRVSSCVAILPRSAASTAAVGSSLTCTTSFTKSPVNGHRDVPIDGHEFDATAITESNRICWSSLHQICCRIGTAWCYGGGKVRRAQIIRFWASLCAPGICWRAGRERWFVPEAGWPGGRHTDALPRGDLRLFGSAAHSPSIHHPARRRWLPSVGQAGRG